MKPGAPLLQSTRLLDQVRERVRYLHYSLKTEKAYLYWIRFFIRWSAAQGGGMRHPREMGVMDVEAFLTMLANERKVSASTHNQALSAVLFLYREVFNIDLPWLNNIGRPQQTKRIPSVLTKDEVAGLLAQLDGVTALLARLLYGTGMRLMEGMRLRIKDVDFDRHVIIVREAKGGKDRVVMLPRSLAPALRLTHAAAWNGATICMKIVCSGRLKKRWHWRVFASRFQSYLAPLVCHAPAASRYRHSHRARATRPQRRQHHHNGACHAGHARVVQPAGRYGVARQFDGVGGGA